LLERARAARRLDISAIWAYIVLMLKLIGNIACLCLIVWVALAIFGKDQHKAHKGHGKAHKVATVKPSTSTLSPLPQDVIGDMVAEIAGNAANTVALSLDTMIQNEGNRMIESGSKNLEREVQNVGKDLTDSLQSGIQSQIDGAMPF